MMVTLAFYYEVRLIARMIRQSQEQKFFYFIDEIFRGTNNRERSVGSEQVIRTLVSNKNTLGVISTHDLELARLEKTLPQVANYHFKDDVTEGQMSFSYKISQGPCPTTNALKIMAKEGIPIPKEEVTAGEPSRKN